MTTSFFGITDFVTYVIGTIAVILLPGPNSMYCLYVGSTQGIKRGYQSVAAILLGDTLLMVAAVMGAATLLKTSATLFFVFKVLGGLYLAYLGLGLLASIYKNKNSNAKTTSESEPEPKIANNENVFLKAFTLSISNPKAILFFLSFFLQFVDPTYANPALSFLILGVTLQVISFAYLSILIFSGMRLVDFFRHYPLLGNIGRGSVGMLFISFAVSLWLTDASTET